MESLDYSLLLVPYKQIITYINNNVWSEDAQKEHL